MSSKNWIQKKVNLCRTVMELFWPILYGLIIGLVGLASDI